MDASTPRGHTGHTLVELIAVLALLAIGASAAAPTARRFAAQARVAESREVVAQAFVRGRAASVASGGSRVIVTRHPAVVRIDVGDETIHRASFGDERTTVELGRGRDSLTLRFDGLGIGRFTSATVLIRRGEAHGSVVLSSYGRIRRR